jgi:hypothetical protein
MVSFLIKHLKYLLVIIFLQSCVFHYFEKYTRVQIVNDSATKLSEVYLMLSPKEFKSLAKNLESNENSLVVEVEERGEFPIEIRYNDSLIDTLRAVEMRGGSKRVVIKQINEEWMVSN